MLQNDGNNYIGCLLTHIVNSKELWIFFSKKFLVQESGGTNDQIISWSADGQIAFVAPIHFIELNNVFKCYHQSHIAEGLSSNDLCNLASSDKQLFVKKLFFCFILLTHEGSHRELYQEFQPSHDIFPGWRQGLFRSQVPSTPSLHCPIANSASTQSQQPV